MSKELIKEAEDAINLICQINGGGTHESDLITRLLAALKEREWRPISEAKKLEQGMVRIYSYKPVIRDRQYASLSREYRTDCVYGLRECDYYIDLPPAPEGE